MKKFFTLILIFGLTIQIFATKDKQDRIEKGIESFNKYDKDKKNPIGSFSFEFIFTFWNRILFTRKLYWWRLSTWI